jgi:hypothetical protein
MVTQISTALVSKCALALDIVYKSLLIWKANEYCIDWFFSEMGSEALASASCNAHSQLHGLVAYVIFT